MSFRHNDIGDGDGCKWLRTQGTFRLEMDGVSTRAGLA